MSEELKDDMVIGIDVRLSNLTIEAQRWLHIGKAACETDPSIIGFMAGELWLAIAKHSKASCPIELIKCLWKVYAAGLAAAKPKGWRVEIGQRIGSKHWYAWLYPPNHCGRASILIADGESPDRAQYFAQSIITELNATVVVPVGKKGEPQ